MSSIKHLKIDDLNAEHECEHDGFEYFKKDFVPKGYSGETEVSVIEIPPLKSAYPYHYHLKTKKHFILSAARAY